MVMLHHSIRARSGQLPPIDDTVFDKRSPPPIRSSAVSLVGLNQIVYCHDILIIILQDILWLVMSLNSHKIIIYLKLS